MATVNSRIADWAKMNFRGSQQVNSESMVLLRAKSYNEIFTRIADYCRNGLNIQEGMFDLEAGQSDYDILPQYFYNIAKIDVKIDGKKYVPLTKFYPNNLAVAEQELKKRVSISEPKYVFFNDKIRIYPTPQINVHNGIFLSYSEAPVSIDGSTNANTLGLSSQFLDVVDTYMGYLYFRADRDPIYQEHYAEYNERMKHLLAHEASKDERESDDNIFNFVKSLYRRYT